ncbi:MAG: hypothetical protein J6Z50_05325 [Fibrobacterales bacterium]|nr:hypothetical protein [Fibrobacterales bacterium]
MAQTLFVIVVAALSLALVGVGLYYGLQKKQTEEEPKPQQLNSGAFSIVRVSPEEALRKIKPTADEVAAWLAQSRPEIGEKKRESLAALWEESIRASVEAVDRGDRDGRNTYRYEIPERERPLLPELTPDTYITRETVFQHPELLPPFFVGSRTRLVFKEADSALLGDGAKSGWKPLLPTPDGKYSLPDWRTLPQDLD